MLQAVQGGLGPALVGRAPLACLCEKMRGKAAASSRCSNAAMSSSVGLVGACAVSSVSSMSTSGEMACGHGQGARKESSWQALRFEMARQKSRYAMILNCFPIVIQKISEEYMSKAFVLLTCI